MNARELEIALALRALEARLLALLDTRTAALWSMLPRAGEPGSGIDTIVAKLPADEAHHHG